MSNMRDGLIQELDAAKEYFLRSISCLQEKDSNYKPTDGSLSVAHHVAHTAHTIEWFANAMTDPNGFDMDIEGHWKFVIPINSLTEARDWLVRAVDHARATVNRMSEADLLAPFPAGPVMGGYPKLAAISGITDHCAHHRGALTVYSRLLGYEPKMPYMDM